MTRILQAWRWTFMLCMAGSMCPATAQTPQVHWIYIMRRRPD